MSVTAGAEGRRTGRVSFNGAVREVDLSFVPEARVGDYVIVHVGIALSVIDEAEARETLALWKELLAEVPQPGETAVSR